ncbi:MAG: helix-turn-helix domain containing protein [Planctomycetaceae bacterium]|nr:helix-turn-helix domain containing protein [Planctomycetaceae bacterium]
MEVEPRPTLDDLKQLERAEKDARASKRLREVILATEGWTASAMAMGLSGRVCQEWVYRFNENGLAGLEDHRGRQPSSPLTPDQEQPIRQRIEAGPTAQDGVCSLRGADVRRFLQHELGLIRWTVTHDRLRSISPRPLPVTWHFSARNSSSTEKRLAPRR